MISNSFPTFETIEVLHSLELVVGLYRDFLPNALVLVTLVVSNFFQTSEITVFGLSPEIPQRDGFRPKTSRPGTPETS